MLFKSDEGVIFSTMHGTFTNWRRRWQDAYRLWCSLSNSDRVRTPDFVVLKEPVHGTTRSFPEGKIEYFLDPASAEAVAEQDPQYSPSSLDAAPVNVITITDPQHLYPSGKERAQLMLRSTTESVLPIKTPWGSALGGSAGFVVSTVGFMAAAEAVGLLGFAMVAGGTLIGGIVGSIPVLRHGKADRVLGAGHLVESDVLFLAARAWTLAGELRTTADNGELDLTASQMRKILWEAADYLDRHDRNTEIDYSVWDSLEPVVTAVNDSLDAWREQSQKETDGDDDTTNIDHHRHMLEQNLAQLTIELEAIARKEENQ